MTAMNKRQRKKHGISPVVYRIVSIDRDRSAMTTVQERRRLPKGFKLGDELRHFNALPAALGSYGIVAGDCIDIYWSRQGRNA